MAVSRKERNTKENSCGTIHTTTACNTLIIVTEKYAFIYGMNEAYECVNIDSTAGYWGAFCLIWI